MASPRVRGSYRLRSSAYPFRVRGSGTTITGTGAFAAAPAVLLGASSEVVTGTGVFTAGAASLAGSSAQTLPPVTGSPSKSKRRQVQNVVPRPASHPVYGKGGFEAAPASLQGFGDVGPDPRLIRDDADLLLLLA